jgi:hypothetical protein
MILYATPGAVETLKNKAQNKLTPEETMLLHLYYSRKIYIRELQLELDKISLNISELRLYAVKLRLYEGEYRWSIFIRDVIGNVGKSSEEYDHYVKDFFAPLPKFPERPKCMK